MQPNVVIERGQELIITTRDLVGNNEIASTSYKTLPNDVKVGDMILVDDGKIELKVKEVRETDVVTGGSVWRAAEIQKRDQPAV